MKIGLQYLIQIHYYGGYLLIQMITVKDVFMSLILFKKEMSQFCVVLVVQKDRLTYEKLN